MLRYYKIRKRSTDEYAILTFSGLHYSHDVSPVEFYQLKSWLTNHVNSKTPIDFSDHQILAYEFTEVPSERWLLEVVNDIREELIVQKLR